MGELVRRGNSGASILLAGRSILLGDTGGIAMLISSVLGGDADERGTVRVAPDHFVAHLGEFLPALVRSLDASARSAEEAPLGVVECLRMLSGCNAVRLLLPDRGVRLSGLDPSATCVHQLDDRGVPIPLPVQIPAKQLANLARTGSGPMLVTLLAIEAGIEQILDKLRQIEGKVDEILKGMERERTARMSGTVAYLSDIAGTIRAGRLDSDSVTTFSGELENTDREARGFSEEYRAMLRERLEEFENLDIAGANVNIDDDVKAIRGAVSKVEDAIQGLLLSLSVRMITMRVRGLLPIEQESTRQRVERLSREIDELLATVARSEEIMRTKAEEIHGLRQEVVQKTGSLLGGAGKLVGRAIQPHSIGGKLAKEIAGGAAGLVGSVAGNVGRLLEGAAGVEEARRLLNEEFDAFEEELRREIEGVREDGHIVASVREKDLGEASPITLDLSVGEDGKVYVRA